MLSDLNPGEILPGEVSAEDSEDPELELDCWREDPKNCEYGAGLEEGGE